MVAENMESTIVAKYDSEKTKETKYQSEADLEKAFIKQLQAQAYEYLPLKTEQDLINNLRKQLEKLNHYQFDDKEWEAFFKKNIANPTDTIADKTYTIQEDYIKDWHWQDKKSLNIYLFDKKNIHNNTLQVINQYVPEGGTQENRYDVSVLVNGLPLVHIELKRRGVDIKEAFNQINRYQRESFWSGCGLFEYIQVFVISNGTYTKYYSNTTRDSHIKEAQSNPKTGKKTSNSFEYTSWWADKRNKVIPDLMDFSKTFFAKHIIINMFLTGFDSTTLNTLWVDKNLQLQGLLQAYSRTNRILNSIKTFGNIVCFRNLEEATNRSIALFGNKEAGGIVLLKTFNEYYKDGYKDEKGRPVRPYTDLIAELQEKYPVGTLIESEKAQKEFIKLYGGILKVIFNQQAHQSIRYYHQYHYSPKPMIEVRKEA